MSSNQTTTVAGVQEDDGTFQRKTFADIERDILERARDELGENVDLSQGSPIKQLLDVTIYEHERTWQVLEDLYYSSYYEDAYEAQLDKILSFASIDRIPRRGATGEVSFGVNVANTSDVTIERGTVVETAPSEDRPAIPFKTTEVAILEAGESSVDKVPIRAGEPWEDDIEVDESWLGDNTNVPAHTITEFRTSVSGVDTVTNPAPTGITDIDRNIDFVRGRDRETDAELRDRFEETRGEAGVATLNNIRSSVEALPEAEAVGIEENTSMVDRTDDGGLPPKSFRVTVYATIDNYHDEIAGAIGENRAAGIESYGSEQGTWVSDDEVERTESFDLADEIQAYVDVTVTHDNTFPDDGNILVENAIIEYIGGETIRGDEYDGVEMTEDVIYDLVYKAALSVRGVWRADVRLDTTEPATATSDIEVGQFEVANTSPGSISIETIEQERP